MNSRKLALLFALLICVSCNKDDDSPRSGTLIFGWFADQRCNGDCASIYKLENGVVYRDIDHNYPEGNTFSGNFQAMPTANYEDYEVLITALPDEIFDEPDSHLNCPECPNGNGGNYLEFHNDDGSMRTWRFGSVERPAYLDSYRTLFIDKMAELNGL